MADVWNFLRDPQARSEMRNALTDSANRGMVAGSLGAPVDLATTLTNLLIAGGGYVGHKTGLLSQPPDLIDSRNVPGSSEWIGQKMQNAGAVSPNRNALAEFGMGLLSPVAYKGAQKMGGLLYNAEQAATANAAKPSTMAMQGQRGMIKIGRERIPETSSEIDKLYESLRGKAEASGARISEGASNLSGSRYMTFDRGDGVAPVQVRISNHRDVHPNSFLDGERFSVDPSSGNTYESAVRWLKENGVNLSAKRGVSIPDWMHERYAPFVKKAAEKLMSEGYKPARLMDANKDGQALMWEAHKLRQQHYGANPYGQPVPDDVSLP